MGDIGIVVLNYKNYTETIKCVDGILEQKEVKVNVVIVDNGSENESMDAFKERYNDNEGIHLIENSKNLGYAKGNNVGIDWLRHQGIDFIIVCNSDVVFSSPYIMKDMYEALTKEIGVMIPIIRNLDGTIEMRAQYRRKLFSMRIIKELLKMRNLKKNKNPKEEDKSSNAAQIMEFLKPGIQTDYYVITGSVFALTPNFFKYYSGLYPETFLYVEELATMLLVHKARLKCAIIETKDVIHKGAASTGNSLKAGTERKRKMIAASAKKVFKLVFMPRFYVGWKYRR